VKELGLHIAAANPLYARREDVPADVLDKERAIYRAQMENSGKPANVIEKIIDGKINAYFEQTVLLDQPSIRDPKMTVGQNITALIAKLGENIAVPRFARFKVGETNS